jgi:hypothetical protein
MEMSKEKLTIEELHGKQESLQNTHDKAQASFQASRVKYAKAKQGLIDFNQKYGRMLKLVVTEAEQAKRMEEAKGGSEAVTLTADDVGTVEIVNDPPVDKSAEE